MAEESYPLSRMNNSEGVQRTSHSRHSSRGNGTALLGDNMDDDNGITVFPGDERDWDSEEEGVRTTPAYPDEDIRPTSQKEIYGWYSYAWASEVFAICAMGSFIPVLLEQLAREKGHILGSPESRCKSSENMGPGGASGGNGGVKAPVCVVDIMGFEINTASFVMYTFSLSVMFQALVIISMSGAADHGRYRKQLLLIFAYIGAVACILMLFVNAQWVGTASLLAQIGNVTFGASYVLMNSFLPLIVRNHPSLKNTSESRTRLPNASQVSLEDEDIGAEDATLLGGHTTSAKPESNGKMTPAMRLSTGISSNGIAIGYCGGVILQILCIMIVVSSGSTTNSLQVSVFCVGLWWFFFTIPSAMTLRPRPGPPLPLHDGEKFNWVKYITYSWLGLFQTIRQASKLRDVSLFLVAWFMVSDGVATIASSAIVFAKTNLGMSPPQLAAIGVIMPISGVIGAFSWPKISHWAGWSVGQTISICISMFALIPLYGLMGLLKPVQDAGFGLTRPGEMYALAIWFGFVLGGQGGYCRSLFSELLPRGSEAAFFALYAITDKGSSIFGPTIVGLITDRWGDIRLAFWFILGLLLVPLPFLYFVDVHRGKQAAEDFVREREARGAEDRDENFS
ncbi:Autophagy protein 22 [Orbilia oligospora]|uniref:Autophagy-related protein n=2 Tax=Orbilia oligospora TaxID=2813651 RepID=A0A7C8NGF3_ORBOL|nr:Autophagy protein 22 [Orbilia oligospora]